MKLKWNRLTKIKMLDELMDEAEAGNWSDEFKDHIDCLIGTLIAWCEIDNLYLKEIGDIKYSIMVKASEKERARSKERAKHAHV